MTVDTCSKFEFPLQWGIKRIPARPLNLREPNPYTGKTFDEMFDWNNLWYDVIQVNKTQVICIGPPVYEAAVFIGNNCKFFDVKNNTVSIRAKPYESERVCHTLIDVTNWVDEFVVEPGNLKLKVNKPSNEFDGKNVIITCQKDNPVEWLQQWITYYRDIHNITNFIIYDNNSEIYTASELSNRLSGLNANVKIVEWNVPHGPFGVQLENSQLWDSDYVYTTMLEHAKLRYLANAKSACNVHPDELLVTNGRTYDQIVEDLINNNMSSQAIFGKWIEPYDLENQQSAHEVDLSDRIFARYYCQDKTNTVPAGQKWITIPKSSMNYQWCPHHLNTTDPVIATDPDVYFAHFLPINTNWTWPRDEFKGDVSNLVINQDLKANLDKLNSAEV